MTESERLVATVKRLLKAQGHTYKSLARELGISEPSVKRMFSRQGFTLARLARVSEVLGMSLAELTDEAARSAPRLRTLAEAQERELVSEPKLLLVAACVVNGWTAAEIMETYAFTKAEAVKLLLRLDRMGLIALLPGDRVRVAVARDFEWLRNGPIERFFRGREKDDFLASDFAGDGEALAFFFAMLTPAARARLKAHVDRLREAVSELHRESLAAPFEERSAVCLLLAHRNWEPRSFAALRRDRVRAR
jgi:transcriptional regulator with XRE-family HTH domain